MKNYWYIRPWEAAEVVADSALFLMVIACAFWAIVAIDDAFDKHDKGGKR